MISIPVIAQENPYLLVGTYTGGKSKGIYVYEFNSADGSAKIIDSIKASNPSFLAISENGKQIYGANCTMLQKPNYNGILPVWKGKTSW